MTTRKKLNELKDPCSMRGRGSKFNPEFYKVRPSQERLLYLFEYIDEGKFIRRNLPSSMSRAKVGEVVKGGICTSGYYQIHVDGVYYFLHRLIWVYHNGYWEENEIDHINRVRTDNRIENLRAVSKSCNARNTTTQLRSTSGIKGVVWSNKENRWRAHIRSTVTKSGLSQLCSTADLAEAACYRLAAEQCLDWHTCDANSSAYQYLKQEGILK